MTDDRKAIGDADTLGTHSPAAIERRPGTVMPADCIGGRYEVLGWIGAGGMGSVYRVRDRELDEIVALKMLRRELVGDAASLARFRQEVKLARRVTHVNVARTFDIGEHAGEKFLTMEYVEGNALSHRIARGPVELTAVVEIGATICAGLAAAHAAGVVHRDLKPDNVLLEAGGRVVITDFGIARTHVDGEASATGALVGTPAYMAPEQVEGAAVIDTRADLYALGAMLFELATGRMPWQGPSPFVVAAARLTAPPPDPRALRSEIPDQLAACIQRCMARAPGDRFARAEDVAVALRAVVTGRSTARAEPVTAIAIPEVPLTNDTTVAVLPLRNGGPPEHGYVADGLTDDLIDTLSMTGGLRVRPRGMVARYEGVRGDPRIIGGELGVQVVVDGSVTKLPDTVRLGIRVISVAEGFQLWAGRFDSKPQDLLVVIDQAARAIATALAVKVIAPVRSAPTDALAIDLYLRARHEFRRNWHSNMTGTVDLFEQALARAPDDPDILTGCALALARMAFLNNATPRSAVERSRELAERAVKLAPHHGDSWAALSNAHTNAGDPIGAVRVLRTGVATAPRSPLLQEMLGRTLLEIGDVEQAIARLKTALLLDPTAVAPEFELARAYALLGDWDSSDEIHARPQLDSATCAISRARLTMWRRAPAYIAPEATPPDSYQRLWAQVLASPALDAEQRAFMSHRTTTATGRLRTLFWQRNAEVFAFVGEEAAALAAVEEAIAVGLIDLLWIDRCPLFPGLRDAPGWAGLRVKVVERVRPIAEVLGVTIA